MFPVEKQGAVCVLRPQSPLSDEHSAAFVDAALAGVGACKPMLVVDMHGVPLIDSAGLESLVDLRERLESRGGSMKLAAINALCHDILRVTGVGNKFEQYPQVKNAVGRFAE
jgi:anti-anti-sigma factor